MVSLLRKWFLWRNKHQNGDEVTRQTSRTSTLVEAESEEDELLGPQPSGSHKQLTESESKRVQRQSMRRKFKKNQRNSSKKVKRVSFRNGYNSIAPEVRHHSLSRVIEVLDQCESSSLNHGVRKRKTRNFLLDRIGKILQFQRRTVVGQSPAQGKTLTSRNLLFARGFRYSCYM